MAHLDVCLGDGCDRLLDVIPVVPAGDALNEDNKGDRPGVEMREATSLGDASERA